MPEAVSQPPLAPLLRGLHSRAWFWLFRQAELQRGLNAARQVTLSQACWPAPAELEVRAQPAPEDAFESRETAVFLRLTENGSLSVTTACGRCGRPYCWHGAAVLGRLLETDAGRAVSAVLRPAAEDEATAGPLPARVPVSRPPEAETPVLIEDPSFKPVLLLKRLRGSLQDASVRGPKNRTREVSLGVAVPLIAFADCPDRVGLATSRLISHHEYRDGDGRRVRLRRDTLRERSLLTELRMAGLESVGLVLPDWRSEQSASGALTVPLAQQALFWARFRESIVPALVEAGWSLEIAPDFGFQILTPDAAGWFSELGDEPASGGKWFALNLGFAIDGRRVSLVPVLSRALDEGLTPEVLAEAVEEDRGFLLVLDGEPGDPVVEIKASRLLPLMTVLTEIMSLSSGGRNSTPAPSASGLRIDRLRAAQLAGLDGLHVQSTELAKLRERLQTFEQVRSVPAPAGLRATLRDYQAQGLAWLQFLREFELHGVLADDMGLGKTLQTIAHLLTEHEQGRADRPSLVIAPTSVLRNWLSELKKFAPDLRPLLLHGSDRKSALRRLPRHHVVITSYPLLVRDIELLQQTPWHLVVLDEAQFIKNPRSQAAQAARCLDARHRLCLTGTPMENHLGELWSLLDFLMPGFLGDAASFQRTYRQPIEKKQDRECQHLLTRRVQPLLLRRTKDAVARELPPKTELLHHIDISGPQADLYETIRALMDSRVREAIASRGMERSHIVVLDALLKLRQVCCHPALLKTEAARAAGIGSAKLDFLMQDLLPELIEEGRRVLIFSQFAEMLVLIEAALRQSGIDFVKLTGATDDRETPVRRFQAGEVPVFLISLKAGGSGLNLTAADTVIHYDPWWNPAAEAQASDRAHRIGQTKPVFVHKLICAGTIEDKILDMQRRKAALLASLLDGKATQSALTTEDVQRLLEPVQRV